MAIPGLHHIPVGNASSLEDVEYVSFNLTPHKIPGAHRFGKCRPLADFEKLTRVGEGSFGTVYKVRDKTSGEIFALKKLKISKDGGLMPQNFVREITNLKNLKHNHIVNLKEVVAGASFESTCLILEFCKYDLSKVIDAHPPTFQQAQIKAIMYQLFAGLDYIHENFIIHRDISPSNILFNDAGILKISDFGSSRKVTVGNVTPDVGLLWYKAPEILFGSTNYTRSVDIWSAACIFGEMLLKKPLFNGDSTSDVITLIINLLGSPTESTWPGHTKLPLLQEYDLRIQPYSRIRSSFSHETAETVALLHRVLLYYPARRFSAETCLAHPYFTEYPPACSPEELLRVLKASED